MVEPSDDDELRKDIAGRALNACCDSCGAVDWSIQEGEYALVAKTETAGLDLTSGVQGASGHMPRMRLCAALLDAHS
jgi:hypothetical protein